MITFPNAKINLGLNITKKRPDGYHDLMTVFYPVPLEDALEIHVQTTATLPTGHSPLHKISLHQAGLEIAGKEEDNLVVRAYLLLDKVFDLPPVDVHLYKHIPSGAGLGGGSSDAAFMLKLLNERFGLGLTDGQLEEYAAGLGADCAFFIRNRATYAEGIGNLFSPVSLSLKGYQIVLVKPDIFVSTREAFSLIKPRQPEYSLKETIALPVSEWRKRLANDFEESVFPQYPAIGKIKEKMYENGATYAAMSGSGSSVFGLFAPDAAIPEMSFDKGSFLFKCVLG